MFEDTFGKLIGEIVAAYLGCFSSIVDIVYVYMNFTADKPFSDVCFCINGDVVDKYFICTTENIGEVYVVESYVCKKVQEIRNAFESYNKNMPLEIKITYDTIKNKLYVDSNYTDYESAKKDVNINKWMDYLNSNGRCLLS